jgi:hypothetical protein
MTIGLVMMLVGVILVAFSIGSMLAHFSPFPNVPVLGAAGAVLFVLGLLLLVTDLMENWLSKGQTALVDGLQAG